jgi:hypothetical protein
MKHPLILALLMGYYDLVAMLPVAGNAMPAQDAGVPPLQTVTR